MNKSYEDLEVWKLGILLAEEVYLVTKQFPKEEIYGLTNQVRRAAISIPSNLAEGCARNGAKEFAQFIGIALGSAAELKTQLLIAQKVNILASENFETLYEKTSRMERMLQGLKKSIQ
jgi:four helix bundle protein